MGRFFKKKLLVFYCFFKVFIERSFLVEMEKFFHEKHKSIFLFPFFSYLSSALSLIDFLAGSQKREAPIQERTLLSIIYVTSKRFQFRSKRLGSLPRDSSFQNTRKVRSTNWIIYKNLFVNFSSKGNLKILYIFFFFLETRIRKFETFNYFRYDKWVKVKKCD